MGYNISANRDRGFDSTCRRLFLPSHATSTRVFIVGSDFMAEQQQKRIPFRVIEGVMPFSYDCEKLYSGEWLFNERIDLKNFISDTLKHIKKIKEFDNEETFLKKPLKRQRAKYVCHDGKWTEYNRLTDYNTFADHNPNIYGNDIKSVEFPFVAEEEWLLITLSQNSAMQKNADEVKGLISQGCEILSVNDVLQSFDRNYIFSIHDLDLGLKKSLFRNVNVVMIFEFLKEHFLDGNIIAIIVKYWLRDLLVDYRNRASEIIASIENRKKVFIDRFTEKKRIFDMEVEDYIYFDSPSSIKECRRNIIFSVRFDTYTTVYPCFFLDYTAPSDSNCFCDECILKRNLNIKSIA
jgi:hypothetical protein